MLQLQIMSPQTLSNKLCSYSLTLFKVGRDDSDSFLNDEFTNDNHIEKLVRQVIELYVNGFEEEELLPIINNSADSLIKLYKVDNPNIDNKLILEFSRNIKVIKEFVRCLTAKDTPRVIEKYLFSIYPEQDLNSLWA